MTIPADMERGVLSVRRVSAFAGMAVVIRATLRQGNQYIVAEAPLVLDGRPVGELGVGVTVLAGGGIDDPMPGLDLEAVEDIIGERAYQPLNVLVADRFPGEVGSGA